MEDLDLKTQSLETTMRFAKLATCLWKDVVMVPLEQWDDRVAFCGQQYGEENHQYAIATLAQEVDWAMFFGNKQRNPHTFDGLLHTEGVQKFTDREEFYARVGEDDSLKIYQPARSEFVGEGDLPSTYGVTFAVDPSTLEWRQLMPVMTMDLVPMREGKFVASIDGTPVQFKSETSPVVRRNVAVVYGYLHVNEPARILVLEEGPSDL